MPFYLILGLVLSASLVTGFLVNRVIFRRPEGHGETGGEETCDTCGRPLHWTADLPLVDLLRPVRTFPCGHYPAPIRSLTMLILVGGSAGLVFLSRGQPWVDFLPALIFLHVLLPLAIIDIRTLTVEVRLVLIGIGLRLLLLILFRRDQFLPMVAGMLIGSGLFTMVDQFYRAVRGRMGLGEGDAVVMGLIGVFVGWRGVLPVVSISAIGGLAWGLPWLLFRKKSLSSPIPFVPFLCVAGLLVYLAQWVGGNGWWDRFFMFPAN